MSTRSTLWPSKEACLQRCLVRIGMVGLCRPVVFAGPVFLDALCFFVSARTSVISLGAEYCSVYLCPHLYVRPRCFYLRRLAANA